MGAMESLLDYIGVMKSLLDIKYDRVWLLYN